MPAESFHSAPAHSRDRRPRGGCRGKRPGLLGRTQGGQTQCQAAELQIARYAKRPADRHNPPESPARMPTRCAGCPFGRRRTAQFAK